MASDMGNGVLPDLEALMERLSSEEAIDPDEQYYVTITVRRKTDPFKWGLKGEGYVKNLDISLRPDSVVTFQWGENE